MTKGYMLQAAYVTRTGRPSTRTVFIRKPTGEEAVNTLIRRLERQGCSKIDIINYGKEKR